MNSIPAKRFLQIALCVLVIGRAGDVAAQTFDSRIRSLLDSVSVTNEKIHLQNLCRAGGYQSRVTFTPGLDKAAVYIKSYFAGLPGILVQMDTFYVRSATPPWHEKPLVNIVATLPGQSLGPATILLGGHYDTSGSNESDWKSNWQTIKAQGADDNGTGIAAILEIARVLAHAKTAFPTDHTIRFIAFAAEEGSPVAAGVSHAGSMFDAQKRRSRQEQIMAVLILDMIACNPVMDYTEIISNTASLEVADYLYNCAALYVPNLQMNYHPFANVSYSDHDSYQKFQFPAVLLMENERPWASDPPNYFKNPYYHTQADSIGTLNFSLLKKVTQCALAAVASWSVEETETTVMADNNIFEDHGLESSLYPNPFNDRTCIRFFLPQASVVDVAIYNLRGQRITTLTSEFHTKGSHEYYWGADHVASGVYICRIQAGSGSKFLKLSLVK